MLQRGKRLAQKEEPLYLRVMAESADLDQLAERFVDLWQDQMGAMAGDPELSRLMRRMLGLWGLGSGPLAASPFAVAPDPGPGSHEAGRNGDAAAPAGAAPARPAPGDAGAVLVELVRRLGALEERLARLEAGSKESRPGPRAKPRRRKAV